MKSPLTRIAFVLALAALAPAASSAQDEPVQFKDNTVIPQIRTDLAGVPGKQVIANIYVVPAGNTVPRHFHHGDEFHLVLSGTWQAEVEGRPTRVLNAGDSQYVDGGRWHGGKVLGSEPLRLLGLMIVDKDKPVTEVVPAK
ncbi:MAG TPA: cupin domain-containing protein [Pseudolabrys sp.]|nr:cupin domain-containing protein [Pseudolabrys sp.]